MALDQHQIVKKTYNSTTQSLKAESSGAASAGGSNLSLRQIWQRIYNSATGKIRTTIV